MDISVEDDKPESARNVLGEPMDLCCEKPLTGFYRNQSQVGIEGFSGMSLSHLINFVLHQKDFIFW